VPTLAVLGKLIGSSSRTAERRIAILRRAGATRFARALHLRFALSLPLSVVANALSVSIEKAEHLLDAAIADLKTSSEDLLSLPQRDRRALRLSPRATLDDLAAETCRSLLRRTGVGPMTLRRVHELLDATGSTLACGCPKTPCTAA
jgi:hypothetical protein